MPDEFFAPVHNGQTPPTYKFFDGKEWKESSSGRVTEIHSPIDGSVVGKTQVVTKEEIDAALDRAKDAQKSWEAKPLHERIKIVHLAADWIRHFEEYLTNVLVWEVGKSASEAKSEIKRTADLTDYYAQEVQSIRGEQMDSDNFPGFAKGQYAMIDRIAWGTVVAIAPFNYPVNLAGSKIAPALLMGNSVVFKPPTMGGISGIHLTQCFIKAGVPEGVITCLTGGGGEVGDYIIQHPKVNMIAFTGNSETGRIIANKANMKPLLFECGGNNPVVVFPDADLVKTAKEIIKGGFAYSGQRCTGIKYVLTTPAIQEQLLAELAKQMPEMVHMGDPRSPETKLVGPVVSVHEAEIVEERIKKSIEKGAKVVTGGNRKDAFIEPTILIDVTPDMEVVATETFGPVVSFITVNTFEEAVRVINKSLYGLQASIFTNDEGAGLMFARQLDVGTVQINGSPQRGPDHFPFMGVKKSGVGVQGVRFSLEAMSRLRSVVINKPS